MPTDDTPEVAALMTRLIDGDVSVLGDLFSHHRPKLWRMVHFRLDRRLAGRIDADDVLQEAWLAARQRIEHWLVDTSRSFYVWLRLIVGQCLIDAHRRHLGARIRAADQEVALAALPATTSSLAGHLLGTMTSPSQAAMRAELTKGLEEALDTMDAIDREVLMLRHFEELSNNETAEVLGLKKTAASNRYVRALTRLRSILEAMPGLGDDV